MGALLQLPPCPTSCMSRGVGTSSWGVVCSSSWLGAAVSPTQTETEVFILLSRGLIWTYCLCSFYNVLILNSSYNKAAVQVEEAPHCAIPVPLGLEFLRHLIHTRVNACAPTKCPPGQHGWHRRWHLGW